MILPVNLPSIRIHICFTSLKEPNNCNTYDNELGRIARANLAFIPTVEYESHVHLMRELSKNGEIKLLLGVMMKPIRSV